MFHILSCIAGLAFICAIEEFTKFLKECYKKKDISDIKTLAAMLFTCYFIGRFILLGVIGR